MQLQSTKLTLPKCLTLTYTRYIQILHKFTKVTCNTEYTSIYLSSNNVKPLLKICINQLQQLSACRTMGDNVERVTSGIRKSEMGWQLDYVSETSRFCYFIKFCQQCMVRFQRCSYHRSRDFIGSTLSGLVEVINNLDQMSGGRKKFVHLHYFAN